MGSTRSVTVYYADNCSLCERVKRTLAELQPEHGFALEQVDIGGDLELEARYREWIPVVEIDGRRRFTYHVHPDALRRAVAQADS